jgi:N-acetylglucosamine repressor
MIISTQKATRNQIKTHNQRLILKTIYDHREISRAEIARGTHLTRPTVSSIVADLIDEGLVAEIGYGPSEGGKPPILLQMVDDSRHLIGIDLANREFRGAVLDLRGQIIHREHVPVDDRNGEIALELVYELIDRLISAATRPILGIGIGTPGLVDAQAGIVRRAVNLDWQDLPLQALLARYELPVHIANDSHVAALGEYVFGRSQKTPHLVVVKVGRGIGAGIVLNGRIHYGDGSSAGEIGHVVVVENGQACLCGHFGCLETVASSRAIVEQAKAFAKANPDSLLHRFAATADQINTDTVLQAFEAGDDDLQAVIAEVGHYLGIAVANLIGVLNLRHIFIGGSVARFGEPLLEAIRGQMKQHAMAIMADDTKVELSHLGQDIVIQGAAALLLTHELGLVLA